MARPWYRLCAMRTSALLVGLMLALATACSSSDDERPPAEDPSADDPRSGGDTTVFDETRYAFAEPAANLRGDRRDGFFIGNAIFNRGWVSAPASVADFDGLGPMFNALGCSGCHAKDGRGRPPVEADEKFLSMLLRLSIPGRGPHGEPIDEPAYGGQLQGDAILGVPPEGRERITYEERPGTYADGSAFSLRHPTYTIEELGYGPLASGTMISPRVAPSMIGLGLLEAIPEDALVARADPDDRDGDGISGRPNRVWDAEKQATVLGRFGWKANQPSLSQQNQGAFNGDMGITSGLFPAESCTPAQTACTAALTGPTPQLRPSLSDDVTYYSRLLAVPARRRTDDAKVRRGRKLFEQARCVSCHVPAARTAVVAGFPELSEQSIRPYTDMLLHDMGDDLSDKRPDFEATGNEWRTPPLWGIGLVKTVNRHELYMHDGRARGFAEAILWHGGEATAAREAFRTMPDDERAALIDFLGSL